MEGQETTEEYRLGELAECLKTGLALVLRVGPTVVGRHLLGKVQTSLGGPGSDWVLAADLPPQLWKLTYAGGRLQFLSSQRDRCARRDDKPFLYGELAPGDRLALLDWELEVVGAPPSLAILEGVSAVYANTRWVLAEGEAWLGREPGNEVRLEDPAISRRHAIFLVGGPSVRLRTHSGRSETRVNGNLLEEGREAELRDGDLLAFGPHVLRLRLQEPAAPQLQEMRLRTLGPFRLEVGGQEIAHELWQGTHVQHAFALLAWQRRAPLGEERLLSLLWGEEDVSRKRLYNIISHLRSLIRAALGCPVDPILRDARGYQLNPALPLRHDLEELGEALRQLPQTAEQALELYRGPFLEGCLLPWAEIHRAQVESDLTEALSRAALALAKTDPARAEALAQRVLAIDHLCEAAYAVLARVNRALGNEREAQRYEELGRAQLRKAGILGSHLGNGSS